MHVDKRVSIRTDFVFYSCFECEVFICLVCSSLFTPVHCPSVQCLHELLSSCVQRYDCLCASLFFQRLCQNTDCQNGARKICATEYQPTFCTLTANLSLTDVLWNVYNCLCLSCSFSCEDVDQGFDYACSSRCVGSHIFTVRTVAMDCIVFVGVFFSVSMITHEPLHWRMENGSPADQYHNDVKHKTVRVRDILKKLHTWRPGFSCHWSQAVELTARRHRHCNISVDFSAQTENIFILSIIWQCRLVTTVLSFF